GILAATLYMVAIAIATARNPKLGPPGPRYGWPQKAAAVFHVWDVLVLFGVVIGGIYLGWFAPTEAAAIGAFGACPVALARRRLTRAAIKDCLFETAATTGMIFLILIGANIFNYFMDVSNLPQLLIGLVQELGWNRYVILAIILTFYVVLGTFFEELSMILLT